MDMNIMERTEVLANFLIATASITQVWLNHLAYMSRNFFNVNN
jgi:hypothetical protein